MPVDVLTQFKAQINKTPKKKNLIKRHLVKLQNITLQNMVTRKLKLQTILIPNLWFPWSREKKQFDWFETTNIKWGMQETTNNLWFKIETQNTHEKNQFKSQFTIKFSAIKSKKFHEHERDNDNSGFLFSSVVNYRGFPRYKAQKTNEYMKKLMCIK